MSIGSTPKKSFHGEPSQFKSPRPVRFEDTVRAVQDLIAPVWPLRDYVAVNPYEGLANYKFLNARERLQSVSDCETLMPLSYYRTRFQDGHIGLGDIELAIDEMVADQISGAESLNAYAIFQMLKGEIPDLHEDSQLSSTTRCLTQHYDRCFGTDWTETVAEEISKFCSSHYDEGQAIWSSPWRDLPLYQAWRSAAQIDRRMELLGLGGVRRFVRNLPSTPETAILILLNELDVPESIWKEYLFCLAMTIPGWSAWTKYKTLESAKCGFESPDFTALLAMRLAYEVALSRRFDFRFDFCSVADKLTVESGESATDESLFGLTLLRANEIKRRSRLLKGVCSSLPRQQDGEKSAGSVQRKFAQMVFCIDVRSERIRRQLESALGEIETFGFAGFFGLPFEYVRMGDTHGTNQLPVLVDPKFKVFEEVRSFSSEATSEATEKRTRIRGLRYMWKSFQSSAVGCFAFVEATGLFYGYKLARKLLGQPTKETKFDGIDPKRGHRVGPGFSGLHRQGIENSQQVDIAESMLRGIGLTKDYAPVVVLCGHAAKTDNNPLQAGLDCGACAGHSGEANARFGAMLLNKPYIRRQLAKRGIEIADDVHFLAGVHNTTTDQISFYDLDLVPKTHSAFVAELQQHVAVAGQLTREERLDSLPGHSTKSLVNRSADWSEVRPEWGLTGNAAFIIGPRDLTKEMSLDGESFLHSYDFRSDPEGKVLEQIMTAPLVVANMINMQYYASTVDHKHFGSGSKTIHNVVGKFGILSGNSGDLTTGLPWQSIHNGESYQHDPVRLLCLVESPRHVIDRILSEHANVRNLVVNGWLNLVALDAGLSYRYSESGQWQQLHIGNPSPTGVQDHLQTN